jgi:predicted nucleic acid-binding protein
LIACLDSSALVKLYVAEVGSEIVSALVDASDVVATAGISRVEVIAGIAKASRLGNLAPEDAAKARDQFESEWPDLLQVPTDEALVRRAAALAWDLQLRGYDAVQLASAITLQDLLGEPVGFVTFDRRLWLAAKQVEVSALPEDLPALLDS